MISAPTAVTAVRRFSQRRIAQNYALFYRTARNRAEQGVQVPLTRHRVVESPTPTKIYVLVLTTQLYAVSPQALSRQAIAEIARDITLAPICGRMISAPTTVTAVRRFSQRRIAQNYALFYRTARNRAEQGVRFCTRGSALCVRDCCPQVPITPYRAKLRIAGCQFLRKGRQSRNFV